MKEHPKYKCDDCGHSLKSASKLESHKTRDHLKNSKKGKITENLFNVDLRKEKTWEADINKKTCFDDVTDFFQKEIVDGKCLEVCNVWNEGLDNFKDVQKHIIGYHQNVLLQLRKDHNEDDKREIYDFMIEFNKDGKRIISQWYTVL